MVDIPPPDPSAPLYQRAAENIPLVADQVLDAFFTRVSAYRHLPHELVDREIGEAVSANLQAFLRSLRERRPPAPEELAAQIATAVRRAQQGVPLDVVLSTYHIAAQVGWEAMAAMAEPDDAADLLATVPALLQFLSLAVPAVASAYLDEQQTLHAERRETRRALVSALLGGTDAEPLAERAGLVLSDQHLVVHLQAGRPSHVQGEDPRLGTRGVARRLHAEVPADVLAALDHNGGTLLVPTSQDTADHDLAGVRELVHRLHVAAGTHLIAGVVTAAGRDDIPAAAQQATDIAELAGRLGRPPGAYALMDVLLEYQLCRPGPGRQRLVRLLDELARHPELMQTLRVFIDTGHNRHQAAAELHIHRNTLNYRLKRIATLTDLSPVDPADVRLLAAALVVHGLTKAP